MSNYPPGVSGFEDYIAGPREEKDDTREVKCDIEACDFEGEAEGTILVWSSEAEFVWDCPKCNQTNADTVSMNEIGPDPDRDRDDS